MDGEAERDIKDIEAEIRTGVYSATGLHPVDCLVFLSDIETEDTEREVAADVLHYKDAETRGIREARVEEFCVCAPQNRIVWAIEVGCTTRETELHLVENTETSAARETDVLGQE